MATEEVYQAVLAVEEARRCLQRCQQDLERATRSRQTALERQTALQRQLDQVERSLNVSSVGQTALGGPRQERFSTGGGRPALLARRKELRALLLARPDQATPLASGMGRFL